MKRLTDRADGTNEVSLCFKSGDYWLVFPPLVRIMFRYTEWKEAIEFAAQAGAVYTKVRKPARGVHTIMINRKNTV